MFAEAGLEPGGNAFACFGGHFGLKWAIHQNQLTPTSERRILFDQMHQIGGCGTRLPGSVFAPRALGPWPFLPFSD
jgi:hypothetical protein